MLKLKPVYGYVNYGNRVCWSCTNFNIITTGDTREKCVKKHIQRLVKYGFKADEIICNPPIDTYAMEFCRNPWKQ